MSVGLALTADNLDAVTALESTLQVFPWPRSHFADSLAAGHAMRVLRVGVEGAGFTVLMTVLDEAHLLNIGVGLGHQRQGHGARMLQVVIGDARVAGAKRRLLEVRRSNRQAVAFYRRSGFTEIGVRRAYYPAVAGREDALVFEKELR